MCQAPPEPPLCEAGQLNIAALVSRWIDGHYYDNGVPLDENISAAGAVASAEDEYFREQMADEIEATRKALCQERMAKVKALLTARQYRRIWMYLAEEKSITEIAKAEGLSKASVSRSVAVALRKLRKLR